MEIFFSVNKGYFHHLSFAGLDTFIFFLDIKVMLHKLYISCNKIFLYVFVMHACGYCMNMFMHVGIVHMCVLVYVCMHVEAKS